MSVAKSTVIPNYLTAATPRGLRRLMLMTNRRLGMWHNYQISFVKDRWFAWYHEDATKAPLESLIEDPKEKLVD